MAYTKTYTFDYTSSANIRYILEFHDQGSNAGTWEDEKGVLGKNNCQIDWGSENAKMYSPLKPSTLTIDFMVTDQKAALYIKNLKSDRQERDVYVYLYNTGTTGVKKAGDSPIFAGYLLMDLSDDPDIPMPYPIKLKAIDGLASLKYYDFIPHTQDQRPDHLYTYGQTWKPGNNNTFDTFYPFTQWISRILQYTGYATTSKGCETNAEFQTSVNWYNSNMANLTGDPLNWTRALADQFYTAEGDTGNIKYKPLNCYDALQFICKTWGMRCFVYRNTFYFIGINTYTATNSGTLASPENINFHRYSITGTPATPSSGDALDLDWGRYHIPVHLTANNKKIAGSQYGILPAFKRVSVDFFNISNINYFQGFPKIPQPYPVSTGSGVMYNEETIGTFDFDGTNQRTFFQQIYLDFQNNSGGDIRYEFRWHIQAKKVGTSTWYQFGYNNWSSSNMLPNWFSMAGIPQNTSVFGRGHLIVPPGASSYNIVTDVLNAPWNGTNINSYVECPTTVFSAGDWEFKYVTVTVWYSGSQNIAYGHGRCDPIPNPGTSYLKDPDSNFITYTDSTILQGAGASMFSPITNGVIGTETTTTQIVQSGSDTEFEEVTDVLWGDLPGAGAGRIQVYTGTGWVPSGFLGTWGVDTLSGNNSLAETLCEEIFKRQAKNVRKFSTKINLDAEDIYQIDSSGSRAMYSAPFTKWFTPSHFSSATFPASWIMHTGNFDTGADTWGLTLYEFETFSVATTTTTTGTNGSNSGGTGTNGSTSSLPNSSGGVGKTFANPTRNNSRAIAQLRQNATRPLTVVTTGQGLTSEGTLTVTSLTVQAIPKAVLKAGDIILLMCAYQPETTTTLDETNTIEYGNVEFEVSSDQSAGDTTISVTSKTIYQIISIGDVVTISQPDLMAQYQNKTRGTVGGFDITANSIDSGSVAISSYIDDDTFASASATSLATSESIKAYVDTQVGSADTLQEVTDNGATTTNSIVIGSGTNSAPGLSFDSDSNTGVYRASENIVGLSGGGIGLTWDGIHLTTSAGGSFYLEKSGSASSPTYSFQSYTSTGMFRPTGLHAIGFSTNGSEKMRVTNTGNILIGTTTDSGQKLQVNGTTTLGTYLGKIDIVTTGATVAEGPAMVLDTRDLTLGSYDNGRFYVGIKQTHTNNTTNDDTIQFICGDSERMRITAGGNLLIGTTTDSGEKLRVEGNVFIHNANATLKIQEGTAETYSFVAGGTSLDIKADNYYALSIYQNGDVLIGGASYNGSKLNVNGTATFSGQVTIPATPVASTDAASKGYVDAQIGANNDLQEVTDNGATTTNDMTISNGAPAMILKDSTSGSSTVIARNSFRNNVNTEIGTIGFLGDGNLRLTNILSNNITFYTSNAEKMRLTSDGRLGISTSNPLATIHASGNIMTNAGGSWATSNGGVQLTYNSPVGYLTTYYDSNSLVLGAGVTQKTGITINGHTSSAGNNIKFRVGNADSMALTTTGLGIGTTSPSELLSLKSTGNSVIGIDGNDSSTVGIRIFRDSVEASRIAMSNSADLSFYMGSGVSEKMRLTTNGLLIGTTTDVGVPLYVNGTILCNNELQFTNSAMRIYRSSDNMKFRTNNTDKLTITSGGNVLIGTTTDDGSSKLQVDGNVKLNDNFLYIGTGNDFYIRHDGSNTTMYNSTGHFGIYNAADGKDITFYCDDGTGGVTPYFNLDGGYSSPFTIFPDGSNLAIGSGLDLRISHSGTNSFIDQTGTGDLYIRQKNDGKDIILQSDNGTGDIASYITLDGSQTTVNVSQNLLINTTTDVGVPLYVNGVIRAVGGGIQAAQDYGFTLNDESGSNRYGLKFGAAGVTGGSNLLMLTNRSFNSATGGGEVAIGGNTNTTGVTEVEIARFIPRVTATSGTQKKVSLDAVLELTEQTAPADPASGESIIWMDSSSGDLKVKINYGGTTVTRTLAAFEG